MTGGTLLEFFIGPATRPFAIAGLILIGLLVVEIASLMMGASLSSKIDALFDLDGPDVDGPDGAHGHFAGGGLDAPGAEPGMFGTIWDWLNAGRVPVLVLLMAYLGLFAGIGYVLQAAVHLSTFFLPSSVATVIAAVAAIPATRWISRIVGFLVPRDESYAVSRDDLIGLTGQVTLGPVTHAEIGRVTLKDGHGNKHFPWVRSATADAAFPIGAVVLLTERQGNEYLVIAADPKLVG